MLTTNVREQLLRKNALEISPEFDSIRVSTFRGVHPDVSLKYQEIYGRKVKANSVPLISDNPRLYLELNEIGDYFLVTPKNNQEHLQGFGTIYDAGSYSLLALPNLNEKIQTTCSLIIRKSRK